MAEYIDKQKAIDAVTVRNLHPGIINALQCLIVDIPAADVQPVRHGRWEWFGDCSNQGLYCSVCRNKIHEVRKPKKKLSNFCPNCGAHMDLEDANG